VVAFQVEPSKVVPYLDCMRSALDPCMDIDVCDPTTTKSNVKTATEPTTVPSAHRVSLHNYGMASVFTVIVCSPQQKSDSVSVGKHALVKPLSMVNRTATAHRDIVVSRETSLAQLVKFKSWIKLCR